VNEHFKKVLKASIWNDTLFLSKIDVMDYSLLVGVEENTKNIVVGIVGKTVRQI
jgi:1-phosphatidylinositol-3-phosphate 5-kinase